jgi:pyruvate/2-oxoglutarate dehydrogenase complex dihydrolipoamide acyltransferase (E2) component
MVRKDEAMGSIFKMWIKRRNVNFAGTLGDDATVSVLAILTDDISDDKKISTLTKFFCGGFFSAWTDEKVAKVYSMNQELFRLDVAGYHYDSTKDVRVETTPVPAQAQAQAPAQAPAQAQAQAPAQAQAQAQAQAPAQAQAQAPAASKTVKGWLRRDCLDGLFRSTASGSSTATLIADVTATPGINETLLKMCQHSTAKARGKVRGIANAHRDPAVKDFLHNWLAAEESLDKGSFDKTTATTAINEVRTSLGLSPK